jgi:hypothetical protein
MWCYLAESRLYPACVDVVRSSLPNSLRPAISCLNRLHSNAFRVMGPQKMFWPCRARHIVGIGQASLASLWPIPVNWTYRTHYPAFQPILQFALIIVFESLSGSDTNLHSKNSSLLQKWCVSNGLGIVVSDLSSLSIMECENSCRPTQVIKQAQ